MVVVEGEVENGRGRVMAGGDPAAAAEAAA